MTRRPRPQAETPANTSAPNAALLIDFDNVTLGIQSDLARELRQLIRSDALGGHVTIQRAYADWRRFPQYLVPLTEASVELVSAPAVGPNKKNATDIRLAIDAMELAFTRPEIGTFILLSGDSDFSALVNKLKEWGKYIIGVGMKESSSDTLMRVCHEYYSYSDLAGLKKSDDIARDPGKPQDPWLLVGTAVAQMVKNRDVMRADRLKQVMQQLDPAFDERHAGKGYGRFSMFVTDAAEKGLISVRKMENGQLEVAPTDGRAPAAETRAPSSGRAAAAEVRASSPGRTAAPVEGEDRPARGRGRGRGRGRARGEGTEAAAPQAEAPRAPRAIPVPDKLTLAAGFELLTTSLKELPPPVAGEALRLRMIANLGREDVLLDASRFDRLLRQAHDAELVEVRKVGEDMYDVAPLGQTSAPPVRYERKPQPSSRPAEESVQPPTPAAVDVPLPPAAPRALGIRRGSRTGMVKAAIPLVGVISLDDDAPQAPAVEEKQPSRGRGRGPKAEVGATPRASETDAPTKPRRPRGRGRGKPKAGAEA